MSMLLYALRASVRLGQKPSIWHMRQEIQSANDISSIYTMKFALRFGSSVLQCRVVHVKNPDGSWGRIEDYYRIVDLHDDGWVKSFDDRIFKSADEAKAAVAQDKSLRLVSYDSIINEAGKIRTAKVLEKLAQSNEKTQNALKPKAVNDKEKTKDFGTDR